MTRTPAPASSPKPDDGPDLVSYTVAAARLGTSIDTVRRAVRAGRLTAIYVRPGGRPRLRRVDVDALIADRNDR